MSDLANSINTFSNKKKSQPLCVLIVFSDSQKVIEINAGLGSNTQVKVAPLEIEAEVLKSVQSEQPDIIIIECPELTEKTQISIEKIQSVKSYPILMFVETTSDETTEKAVAIGVSAFCVNGLISARIKPLVELAFARYEYFTALQRDLSKSKRELEGRKSIERAKGLIMERRQINERDAYDLIRRMSMAKGKSMQDIAETILEFSDFLS